MILGQLCVDLIHKILVSNLQAKYQLLIKPYVAMLSSHHIHHVQSRHPTLNIPPYPVQQKMRSPLLNMSIVNHSPHCDCGTYFFVGTTFIDVYASTLFGIKLHDGGATPSRNLHSSSSMSTSVRAMTSIITQHHLSQYHLANQILC